MSGKSHWLFFCGVSTAEEAVEDKIAGDIFAGEHHGQAHLPYSCVVNQKIDVASLRRDFIHASVDRFTESDVHLKLFNPEIVFTMAAAGAEVTKTFNREQVRRGLANT